MRDLETRIHTIVEAATKAWWGAHGAGSEEIPLGVLAALSLLTRDNPDGPDPAVLIAEAGAEEIAELLGTVWTLFAILRPELAIRVGPFAQWLDVEPSGKQLDGAHATAQAAVSTGLFDVTGDRELACEVDLLGHFYEVMRPERAKKAHGEVRTPAPLAELMARMTLTDVEAGNSICDPAAGTGGLLRAAAQTLRAQGVDPHQIIWYGVDIDPVVVAGLAVNVHLWDLGPRVIIGCADVLAEGDWEKRALAEQNQAIADHHQRVMIARLIAIDRQLTQTPQTGEESRAEPADATAGSTPDAARTPR